MTDDAVFPDPSEQLDQLQPGDSLIDRGVDDVLDEGFAVPDRWSVLQTYGNTAEEMRRGESIDRKITAEVPEPVEEALPWRPEPGQGGHVGARRAGRLVVAGGAWDDAATTLAQDVGIDGGGASAEEAAMHIIDSASEDDSAED